MLDPAQLAKAVDLLDRRFGLEALLIFGSEARGTARADSDVDLAALARLADTGEMRNRADWLNQPGGKMALPKAELVSLV